MADNIFIPNVGLSQKLSTLVSNLLGSCILKLYQNDYIPQAGDAAAMYTECTFSGYAAQSLADLGAVSVVNNVAQVSSGVHTWNHNGGAVANSVYGWFLTTPAGLLIAASRNGSGPIVLSGAGQSYSVQVTFTDARA